MYTSYERADVMIVRKSKFVQFKIWYTRGHPPLVNRFRVAMHCLLPLIRIEMRISVHKMIDINLLCLRLKKPDADSFFLTFFLFTHVYDPDTVQVPDKITLYVNTPLTLYCVHTLAVLQHDHSFHSSDFELKD